LDPIEIREKGAPNQKAKRRGMESKGKGPQGETCPRRHRKQRKILVGAKSGFFRGKKKVTRGLGKLS